MDLNYLFFNDFETLDIMGPIEVFNGLAEARPGFYSMAGGPVKSRQGYVIMTEKASLIRPGGVLVVPGGMGTRTLVDDPGFIEDLKGLCERSEFVLSVCTGSGLLARAGVLDGLSATSNKRSFEWAAGTSDKVDWIKKARWVADGKFYTSSGVSAGIDMALGFVRDRFGEELARQIASRIEYIWNSDKDSDPFCR